MAALAARAEEVCIEVWPENWGVFRLFCRLDTQWRVGGMGGVSGLDYSAVYPLLDRLAASSQEWDEMLEDLQALESGALSEINRKEDSAP